MKKEYLEAIKKLAEVSGVGKSFDVEDSDFEMLVVICSGLSNSIIENADLKIENMNLRADIQKLKGESDDK